jgi:isopenicillin N synthase-like dioxygenase
MMERMTMIMTIAFAIQLVVCTLPSTSSHPSFVVDISALTGTVEAHADYTSADAAASIDKALREYGLVILTGHGVNEDTTASSFTAAYELFNLDLATKKAAAIRNDNSSFGRGYLGFGDESGVAANFEPKEGYSYGSPGMGDTATLLNTPNKWPLGLSADGVHALHQLYDKEVGVAKLIARALSSQFSCAEGGDTLAQIAEGGEHISLMRMFHYFHQGSEEVQRHLHEGAAGGASLDRALLGSSPHTDWGFLTVILADEVGGLQFIPRGGGDVRSDAAWVDVPYIPGSLIINGGDYLSLVSRGVYHSPIHRVLTPGSRAPLTQSGSQAKQTVDGSGALSAVDAVPSKDRYSFVLFFYPAYDSLVSRDVLSHCTHASSSSGNEREKSVEDQAAGVPILAAEGSYNTLLALDGERPRGFGDYVIRKWKGVYRAS